MSDDSLKREPGGGEGRAKKVALTAREGAEVLTQCLPDHSIRAGRLANVPDITGAPEGIRTSDLCLRRATLYPNGSFLWPLAQGTPIECRGWHLETAQLRKSVQLANPK
jgi:hypothetical protein